MCHALIKRLIGTLRYAATLCRIILESEISIFSQYVIISNSIRLYVISRLYRFLYELYVLKLFFFFFFCMPYFACNSFLRKVNFCIVHVELCTCIMTLANTFCARLQYRRAIKNIRISLNSEYHATNVSVSVCCVGYCKRSRDVSHKNMR